MFKEIFFLKLTTSTDTSGRSYTTWKIIPRKDDSSQDGYWRLNELYVSNFIGADGSVITDPVPLLNTNVGDDNYIEIRAVSNLYIDFEYNGASISKYNEDKFEGVFMQTHTVSGMMVKISAFDGNTVSSDTINLVLNYKYVGNSEERGGYTSTVIETEKNKDPWLSIQKTSNNGSFAFESFDLQYAGDYYLSSISVSIGTNPAKTYSVTTDSDDADEPYKWDWARSKPPVFIVTSSLPSVKFTSVSPTGTFTADTTGSGSGHASVTVPQLLATEATVYFKCTLRDLWIVKLHNYTRPSVTITLSGIGNAKKAELNFGTDVHIYNGTTKTTGYSWTANGECSRNIGYYRSTTGNDDKTPAGTISANTLVLTYGDGDITYDFAISTITINNPY